MEKMGYTEYMQYVENQEIDNAIATLQSVQQVPEQISNAETLPTYCKQCDQNYEVLENQIFSGGEFSKYATRCPVCGFGRPLPFKDVEKVFGKLTV